MKRYVIIVAGGQGIRMNGSLPKQFLSLNGIPVLMHTISAFHYPDIDVILVMNKDYISYWEDLCKQYSFNLNHRIVKGGKTRAESVKNGLDLIVEEGVVAVHDAVRPFVSPELIDRLFSNAETHKSAIPVIDVKDTLREITKDGESITVPRIKYRAVQTPQLFTVSSLKKAFLINHTFFKLKIHEFWEVQIFAQSLEAAGRFMVVTDKIFAHHLVPKRKSGAQIFPKLQFFYQMA